MKKVLISLVLVGMAVLVLFKSTEESEALVRQSHQQGGVILSLIQLTEMFVSEEGARTTSCRDPQAKKLRFSYSRSARL
jgi:Tfp pilus assembly protein PilV